MCLSAGNTVVIVTLKSGRYPTGNNEKGVFEVKGSRISGEQAKDDREYGFPLWRRGGRRSTYCPTDSISGLGMFDNPLPLLTP